MTHEPESARSTLIPNGDSQCPLCKGPNACAPAAAGTFQVDCWCKSARIAPALLQAIPEPLRGNACICPTCATAAQAGRSQDAAP